jgi:hypothetical protein
MSAASPLNVAPMADKPTLITVPSMKARLDARIVVTNTQLGCEVADLLFEEAISRRAYRKMTNIFRSTPTAAKTSVAHRTCAVRRK